MGKRVLQWHAAFQAALQVELSEDKGYLHFYEEYNLSKKPLQMDTLIIKLDRGHRIQKSIGRIFRTHNIVEYKSPEDYISVNDFYKVLGYVCVYQADTRKVLEIQPDELTITLAGNHYPRQLVKHLKRQYGVNVRKAFKGIYYVEDLMFPVQLLVTDQLSKEEYAWLGRLHRGLDMKQYIEPLIREYRHKRNDPLYEAVMDIIIRANQDKYEEGIKMCDALNELMADRLAEQLAEQLTIKLAEQEQAVMERGMEKGMQKGIEKGMQKGMEEGMQKGMQKGIEKGIEKGMQKGMEKGIEKGMEKGIQKGIQVLIETCMELCLTRKQVLEKLVCKFELPKETAENYIKTYWKS